MRFLVFLFCFISSSGFCQQDSLSSILTQTTNQSILGRPKPLIPDTQPKAKPKPKPKPIVLVDTIIKKIISDTLVKDTTTIIKIDSILIKEISTNNTNKLLAENPIINSSEPIVMLTNFKEYKATDYLFYLLLSIVFFLSIVQIFFKKYINSILDIFFQPGFRQRQTKEQISQERVGGLLLNILFIVSTSAFISLMVKNNINYQFSFWQIFGISIISLLVIYLVKFIFTMFMGWVFDKQEIASSYNFLIFVINKFIGIILIPILFFIAYANTDLKQLSISTALIILGFLFVYRFFKAFQTLSGRLKISAYHFFIYFCSVEILPLIILYKIIGNYLENGI